MRRQVISVLFVCAIITYTRAAQPKCQGLKADLSEMNITLNNLKDELIEVFESKLQQIKNEIKAKLTRENAIVTEKLAEEVNQNEEKLNALEKQNKVTFSELTAQLTKAHDELSECACERQRQRSIIYYAGPYIYTFAEAKAYCKSKGHKIATPAQLDAAYALGMSECAWGWLSDGTARFPHQMPYTNGWCGSRGVNTWKAPAQSTKFGVYCATNPGP